MIRLIFLVFSLCLALSCSQQFYDQTLCDSNTSYPGTRYTCSSFPTSCTTYLVYRANVNFKTISTISILFGWDPVVLLPINNASNPDQILEPGQEVLVPIPCSCVGGFFQYNIVYKWPENHTLTNIACGVFEGLVKSVSLSEENLLSINDIRVNSTIYVPLKCACPENNSQILYLVTYPFIERDNTKKVSEKFNVPEEEIWIANHLNPMIPTVYPTTTVLIPLKNKPYINSSILETDPPTPQFLPTSPVRKTAKLSHLKIVYIAGSVIGLSLIVALSVACGVYVNGLKNFKNEETGCSTRRIGSLNSFSTPGVSSPLSSTNSCLSPDLLVGIKYSLSNYSMEEIKEATRNFSEDAKINMEVYKGWIDGIEVMIKRVMFNDTRQVIDVHSKINHVNIVKLNGVCYGDDQDSQHFSYLVFDYPSNGSLRDCLSSSSSILHWHRRTQIAFDIATGLHYLHYSIIPAHTHSNLNCNNIFLTSNWRAKITVSGNGKESDILRMAPENIHHEGLARQKADTFAFGVVLLELISGKEVKDGEFSHEWTSFLGGGASHINEGGCFDQLRNFVDPCFRDDYPIAEALCLAVLASSCVDDDPLHRPSMDDVIKILARMV